MKFQAYWQKLTKEIKSHPLIYIILCITLLLGTFIRIYRTGQILGFYFDQGRDAMVIWNFLHNGKFFLVGPTTGIAGIFRGPFYYYLITPFYFLGGGNPVWPANFLSLTTIAASVFIYYLGYKAHSRTTGLFASIIASFSFNLMMAARWLSNPTPMLLLSMILIFAMFKILDKNYSTNRSSKRSEVWWPVIAFTAGLSLFHFGSAGELFYFPAIIIFAIWQRKTLSKKIVIISGMALLFTALPQILFDLRHQGILRQNILKFLVADESFKLSFQQVLGIRSAFYYDVFVNKIFHWKKDRELFLLGIWFLSFLAFIPQMLKNKYQKVTLLVFVSPLIGLLFFQGNFGNIYDYYLTGYYLIFVTIFALTLGYLWHYKIGKLFVLFFFAAFLWVNYDVNRYKIIAGVDGENTIMFGNQKQAIDWIYEDSVGKDFNVDVYVPPVIPHAYDYLFAWYPTTPRLRRASGKLVDEHVPLLYTLYEVDPPHPERLQAWLDRQKGIGEIVKEEKFGGITVQRRKRL